MTFGSRIVTLLVEVADSIEKSLVGLVVFRNDPINGRSAIVFNSNNWVGATDRYADEPEIKTHLLE
jgi:hypothetical protein